MDPSPPDENASSDRFGGITRTRPWALLAAVALTLLGLLFGIILTAAVLIPLYAFDMVTATVLIVVSLVMMQGVAFNGFSLLYLKARGLSLDYLRVRMPDRRDVGWALGGYVLALGAAVFGLLLVQAFILGTGTDAEPATNSTAQIGAQNPEVLLVLIPAAFLLIGPGEELLFRGIIQNRIRESFNPAVGVLLASVIFASIHVTALAGSAAGIAMSISILVFPSLVFGSVYELSDNLVVTAFMHAAYDATLFAGLYLSVA